MDSVEWQLTLLTMAARIDPRLRQAVADIEAHIAGLEARLEGAQMDGLALIEARALLAIAQPPEANPYSWKMAVAAFDDRQARRAAALRADKGEQESPDRSRG